MGESVILFVEDWKNSNLVSANCRICHETEFESCASLEAPCACSGTVKFAHRNCIQRWCDEKGNTVCEICLQKYEHGYRLPPPKSKSSELVDTSVTIRDRLEVVPNVVEEDDESVADCDSVALRSASICRFVALMHSPVNLIRSRAQNDLDVLCSLYQKVTIILFLRHLFALFSGQESENYPFPLVTLLVLRTSGIVIPMYVVIRTITAIQKASTLRFH